MVLALLQLAFAEEPAVDPEVVAGVEPGHVSVRLRQPAIQVSRLDEERVGFHVVKTTVPLCQSPCTLELPPGQVQLRFSRPGLIAAESRFMVPAGGNLVVSGKLGSAATTGVGVGLAVLGGAAYFAYPALTIAFVLDATDDGSVDSEFYLRAEVISLAVCIGAFTTGGILVAVSLPHVRIGPEEHQALEVGAWVSPGAAGLTATF